MLMSIGPVRQCSRLVSVPACRILRGGSKPGRFSALYGTGHPVVWEDGEVPILTSYLIPTTTQPPTISNRRISYMFAPPSTLA